MNTFALLDVYGGDIVPVAKLALEDEEISISDIKFENSECFSKNGIHSVDKSSLRRRFKSKTKVFNWINKTKSVMSKTKKNKENNHNNFDF